jgi:hypothetical protein
MITIDDVKATVMYLLRTRAESLLEGSRPDVAVSLTASRASRQTFGWETRLDAVTAEALADADVREAAWAVEYEQRVRRIMTAEWDDLKATGVRRLQRAVRSSRVPAELRDWGKRQLVKAIKANNPWPVAYAVLVLRDAAEWEAAHDAIDDVEIAAFADSPLAQMQAEWVEHHTLAQDEYDGTPSLKALAGHDEPQDGRGRTVQVA